MPYTYIVAETTIIVVFVIDCWVCCISCSDYSLCSLRLIFLLFRGVFYGLPNQPPFVSYLTSCFFSAGHFLLTETTIFVVFVIDCWVCCLFLCDLWSYCHYCCVYPTCVKRKKLMWSWPLLVVHSCYAHHMRIMYLLIFVFSISFIFGWHSLFDFRFIFLLLS